MQAIKHTIRLMVFLLMYMIMAIADMVGDLLWLGLQCLCLVLLQEAGRKAQSKVVRKTWIATNASPLATTPQERR